MADKAKPLVIDCGDAEFTGVKQEVTRTPEEWQAWVKEKIKLCKGSKGKRHEWGEAAKQRLRDTAKTHLDWELTNL